MSASPAAQERINAALALIQEAQNQMGRAMAELSTLRNIGPTWSKGQKLYDAIHAYWYAVRALPERRGLITTDREPVGKP